MGTGRLSTAGSLSAFGETSQHITKESVISVNWLSCGVGERMEGGNRPHVGNSVLEQSGFLVCQRPAKVLTSSEPWGFIAGSFLWLQRDKLHHVAGLCGGWKALKPLDKEKKWVTSLFSLYFPVFCLSVICLLLLQLPCSNSVSIHLVSGLQQRRLE